MNNNKSLQEKMSHFEPKRMLINGKMYQINDVSDIAIIKKELSVQREEQKNVEMNSKNTLNIIRKNNTSLRPSNNQVVGQVSGQVVGQSNGQADRQIDRQVDEQSSGQSSGQPSGQSSGQSSGQPSGQPSGQSSGQMNNKYVNNQFNSQTNNSMKLISELSSIPKKNELQSSTPVQRMNNDTSNTRQVPNQQKTTKLNVIKQNTNKDATNDNGKLNAKQTFNVKRTGGTMINNTHALNNGEQQSQFNSGQQSQFTSGQQSQFTSGQQSQFTSGQQSTANNKVQEEPENTANAVNLDEFIGTQNGDYYTNKFDVQKSQWYVMVLKVNSNNGMMKIIDMKKNQITPTIKFPNGNFLYQTTKIPISQEEVCEYRIYFKTTNTSNISIHILGLKVHSSRIQQVNKDVVSTNIDVWKLRKLFDIDFTNYYITCLQLNVMPKFVDRLKADYTLFKNKDYFDTFVQNLKLDLPKVKIQEENKVNVLYLLYSNIEYENTGYTLRSHYLLKNTSDEKYKMHGVTRYGYPYDKDNTYYKSPPQEEQTIDGVDYIKLISGTDNYNDNNLLEYLKKYIISVIYLANRLNAHVIHGVSNFWNGVAAVYAAKYLGVKSIYEIRGFWDESTTLYKPESKNSDYVTMMINLEKKVIDEATRVLTINTPLKERLLNNNVPEDKIEILFNSVDTERFYQNPQLRTDGRNKLNVSDGEILMGFIGTISNYEGIEYVLESIRALNSNGYKIKFVLAGDGFYKNTIIDLGKQLGDNFVYVGKIEYQDVLKYYNAMDIIAFPRKNNQLCRSTSSYKIFETMACCKPIIVSDLEACKEIIKDNETGLYCKPDNVEDLKDKIKLLIDNKELREKLGASARQWVIENREWSASGKQLREIYDNM